MPLHILRVITQYVDNKGGSLSCQFKIYKKLMTSIKSGKTKDHELRNK